MGRVASVRKFFRTKTPTVEYARSPGADDLKTEETKQNHFSNSRKSIQSIQRKIYIFFV